MLAEFRSAGNIIVAATAATDIISIFIVKQPGFHLKVLHNYYFSISSTVWGMPADGVSRRNVLAAVSLLL